MLSQFQPRLFEVEVAFHAVHYLVPDSALVAQANEALTLRLKQLYQEALVGGGASFQPVLVTVEAGAKAVAAVVVHPPQALGRVLTSPLLLPQLFEALQGRLG